MHFVLTKFVVVPFLLSATVLSAEYVGTYITEKPSISLERALPVAIKAARTETADFDKFILHSVIPRVLKADPKGMHWQFMWQESEFKTHMRGISVRVYMKDGSVTVEQFEE
jgi:hypothetical protein